MDFLQLIKKAQAEGADTLASPTFPFTPPGETPVTPPSTPEGKTILLQTDTTSVKVQDRITVRVYIDSDGSDITGFNINIDFDPEYFQAIDSDTGTTGVQVNYLDTTFEEVVNIRAEAAEDAETSIARTAAEIEFVALKTGTSEIKVVQTSSNMLSTSSVDILDSTNSINFNISAQAIEVDTNGDSQTPRIPDTGITDHASLVLASAGGLLLIIAGIYLRRITKGAKRQ
jgi:hypothetical protein